MLDQITQVPSPRPWFCVRIEQTKSLILELGRERSKLSCDLEAEETRLAIKDPNHYAYPPLAKALRERRDRVEKSIDTLANKLKEYEAGLATSLQKQTPVTARRARSRKFWRYDRKSAGLVFEVRSAFR